MYVKKEISRDAAADKDLPSILLHFILKQIMYDKLYEKKHNFIRVYKLCISYCISKSEDTSLLHQMGNIKYIHIILLSF